MATVDYKRELDDRIDRVAMHPVWGVPIFLALMYVVFTLTFSLGNPLMDFIDRGFSVLGNFITGLWPVGTQSHLQSLLVDGIIGGGTGGLRRDEAQGESEGHAAAP